MQLAFALTGALLLFNTFIWQGGRKDILSDHSEYIKNLSFKIISVSIFVQPLFLLFYFLSFPSAGLTTSIFAISLSLIALYFVICIVLYFMMKESHTKFSGAIFILLLLSSILFVVMEETTLANSTREQALALANQNELSLKELEKSIGGPSTISGSEVYKLRCSSCHRFDVKVVGPPYKQTMPKYEGKESELAAFILNPKKVNPAFPQMPNPGVKPAEARAVAKYILSEYKK
jgi:cytochrome c